MKFIGQNTVVRNPQSSIVNVVKDKNFICLPIQGFNLPRPVKAFFLGMKTRADKTTFPLIHLNMIKR